MIIPNDMYLRLARAEAMANLQRSELLEVLMNQYKAACDNKDADLAANLARKIRDKFLNDSDKQMTLDRLQLDTSSATKFLISLANIFTGNWARYRQALRDVTNQEGFPFNIEWPQSPDAQEEE